MAKPMKDIRSQLSIALMILALLSVGCGGDPETDSYQTILENFIDPPASYRSMPFWVWNDSMTRDQILEQLTDFRDRGFGGVFIHPRPGLITPYLSEDWLSLCQFAVDTAKSLGLEIWLYDENSYPSGFAGGHVPAQMPDSVQSGLTMAKFDGPPGSLDKDPVALVRQTLTGFENVTQIDPRSGPDNAAHYVFDVVRQNPSAWYGGFTYVDLMREDVTQKFLEVTLDAYKRVLGEEFGRTVPGVFQDEAEIAPAGGQNAVSYTPALFEAFQEMWGYDLKVHLPSLFEDVGDWCKVRHNYYAVLLDLFIENWAKPYYAYCTENDLVFTGHYWEHAWPVPRISPDNLALAAYAHMPGIDILMNDWDAGPQAQFGNARAVREIRSAANQLGRRRTLSETYGASGWDLTFFDQKRIGDWEYALGVNFLNQHLSFASLKGARKRDHPLSFSYHEPWWPSYAYLADYFARLSVALSSGEQVNTILVLEPTTSAWMHFAPFGKRDRLQKIGEDFQNFIHLLEAEKIEYDLVSEKTLQEYGRVTRERLTVGERDYDLLVFPPGLMNLDRETVELLRDYLLRNGKIISWVGPPDYLDGQLTDEIRTLAGSFSDRWMNSGPGSGFDKIRIFSPPILVFEDPRSQPDLFHHRREFRDGQIVFLANTHPSESRTGHLRTKGGNVEKWDPFTGAVVDYPFERDGTGLVMAYSLPPGGSLLLCVRPETEEPTLSPPLSRNEIPASERSRVERISPNVLVLDYCDLAVRGKSERNLYFYDAQKKAFTHHGFERNPWDGAVQYKTRILDRNIFPPDSGFDAHFTFDAEGGDHLEQLLGIVERPDLFRVEVNGRRVQPLDGEWWLDRDFGVFPIGPHVRKGRNTLTVTSRPFSVHSELEPVYILGDFRLENREEGFRILPPGPLDLGSWSDQGLPFYGSSVKYTRIFQRSVDDVKRHRYYLRLENWQGAVAEVRVGGRSAGLVAFPPYELEITEHLAAGPNEIEVIVIGTLRNTLGPHHGNSLPGRAWPGSFQRGAEGGLPPGREYRVLDYGLFEDFTIWEERRD